MRAALSLLSICVAASSFAELAPPATRDSRLSPESLEATLAALGAGLDVERDLLRTQQELYRQAAVDRDLATRRLMQLLSELDAMVQGPVPVTGEAVGAKEKEISDAESRRQAGILRCGGLIGRIQEIQERVSGLERKVATLKEGLPKTRETLTGSWRVTYLPGLNKGVFSLRQAGTIVQGQYQLEGGWRGSLTGTFVDGKVYLQRIDSKLGRSSELEGYLASDGSSIRGTWRNYNLTDGAAASGSWTASRQDE